MTLQVMIYKHISDISEVTSANTGWNYANLISTSAYRRSATTGTSKEYGADRWSLQVKLSARSHAHTHEHTHVRRVIVCVYMCMEILRAGHCLEAANFAGCSVMFHTNECSLCPINTRKESTRKQKSDYY